MADSNDPFADMIATDKSAGADPFADMIAGDGAPVAPRTGGGEALARGGAQGATLGFGDELSSALSSLVPTSTDREMGRGYTDRYRMNRDQMRKENAQSEEDHPNLYGTGELVGGLAPGVLGGELAGAAAPGLMKSAPILSNMALGGAQGAANAVGSSNASGASDLAKEALGGGAGGALFAGGVGLAGKAFNPNVYTSLANRFRVNALGNKNKVMKELGEKGVQVLGQSLKDKGIVNATDSREAIFQKVASALKEAGEGLGSFEKDLPASESQIPIGEVKKTLDTKLVDPLSKTEGRVGDSNYIKGHLDTELYGPHTVESEPPLGEGSHEGDTAPASPEYDSIGVPALRKFRGTIDDHIGKWGGETPDIGKQKVLRQARDVLEKDVIEPKIQQIGDSQGTADLLERYRGLKKDYSQAKTSEDLVKDTQNKMLKNRLFSLSDYLAGGVAGGTLGLMGESGDKNHGSSIPRPLKIAGDFVLGAGVNKFARVRGNQLSAGALDLASFLTRAAPEAGQAMLGKFYQPLKDAAMRGVGSLASTHFVLQQSNPEFRELLRSQDPEPSDDQGNQ